MTRARVPLLAPRWRKLVRDLWVEKERMALMVLAIALSLAAVGAMLGAFTILRREMAANYMGTHPASATLELEGDADAALVAAVRTRPGIADAEAHDVLPALVRVGRDRRPMLLFVTDDLAHSRLNRARPLRGAWPPPTGSLALEHTAVEVLRAGLNDTLTLSFSHGRSIAVPVSALVHDPGLAPAWQERTGYGYVSRATLARLGQPPVLHELRIAVRDRALDAGAIDTVAQGLAGWLTASGHAVHQIRIPPPGRHPHQSQMTTMLLLLVAFAALALVLSAILVATSLAGLLARQVREIGVMKTLGARTRQIAAMYSGLVALLGALAFVLAWPLGVAAARALATGVAALLNLTLADTSVPAWVTLVQAAAGLAVPLLVASVPILRAARTTVREAIDEHGAGPGVSRLARASLPAPVRDALRRPARLALTLALLAAGGAMFMAALDVSASWERLIARVGETRHYDAEVRFRTPEPIALAAELAAIPGVRAVEPWCFTPAAFARPGRVDVVRTYPDRGHGSLAVLAAPADSRMVTFPLLAGRLLRAGDRDGVVLSHVAYAQAGRPPPGSRIALSLDGRPAAWRLIGVVEEVGSPGRAYVTAAAFESVTASAGRTRLLRIATSPGSTSGRAEVLRAVDDRLAAWGADVESLTPLAELRTAIGGHVLILIRALLAMATVMGGVGLLGLMSTMGISVLERRREFGVMKAIGATSPRVAARVVKESLVVALMSGVLATGLSVPLAAGLDALIGSLGFLAPLPFVVSPGAMAGWLVLLVVGTLAASWAPSLAAARLTVRDALVQL